MSSAQPATRGESQPPGTGPAGPRRLLAIALVVAVVLAPVVLAAAWLGERAAVAERERHGSTVVRRLAASAADSLLAGDRIALNVLARDFTTLPGVATAALYGADDRLLAAADASSTSPAVLETRRPGTVFVEQITLQESIAGYARVALDADAFRPASRGFLLLVALLDLLAVLALAATFGDRLQRRLARLRAGAADALGRDVDEADDWRALGALLDPPAPTPAAPRPVPDALEAEAPKYVVVVNLFNQISLSNAEREDVLDICDGLLDRVCRLYGGRCERLPGTGFVVALDAADAQDDPAFQAICTALLAARVFDDLNHERRREGELQLALRIGVERLVDDLDAADAADDAGLVERLPESISRGVTLSALARGSGVVIGDAVHAACADADRIVAEPVESPVLRAASGDANGRHAWLVIDLAPGYRDLLDRQAALLLGGI